MPLRKSSSAKTYAIALSPMLVCQKVRIKSSISLSGFESAYQVIDLASPPRRVGRSANTAQQAWSNAYNRLLAWAEEDQTKIDAAWKIHEAAGAN